MKTYLQGTDLTITVPLTRDGEPFVPDAGNVGWVLRGQDGAVLVSGALSSVTDSSADVVVSAAYNTVAGGRQFEKRNLVLTGQVGGEPFLIRQAYSLVAWLNYTASPDDVRAFIGIGAGELPDSDIDLASSYFDVCTFSSQNLVDAALAAGDQTEIEANRAIVARAVLIVLPSLQARIAKSESDGTIDVTRFDLDLDLLQNRAANQLSRSLDIFSPRTIEIPALIVVTDRPDIFRSCARF